MPGSRHRPGPTRRGNRYRLRVEMMEDRVLLATVLVTGTGDTIAVDGVVTLREAITSANGNADVNADVVAVGAYGSDTINFNIPAAGVQTINPTSALPPITDELTIDGYSQPGTSPNTNTPDQGGSNAVLFIELNGANAGAGVGGLDVRAGGSTVRGLVINRFGGQAILLRSGSGSTVAGNFLGSDPGGTTALNNLVGVQVDGLLPTDGNHTVGGTAPEARNVIVNGIAVFSSGNRIQGNLIGTNAAGTVALGSATTPSSGAGVGLTSGDNNVVGGTTPAARNVISGNTDGVSISSGSIGNVVQGNYIGTDVTGTVVVANAGNGVRIVTSGNTIGGTVPGAGNLISGNQSDGVEIDLDSATGNLVQGNLIGTNAAGSGPLGNSRDGVQIFADAVNNTIGGTVPGAGNVIAFNGFNGVFVSSGTGNAIQGNSIFSNSRLGIELGNFDAGVVTPNDPGDGDTGPNGLQNFPILTSATVSGSSTIITGILNSTAGRTFRIEFFSNPGADPSGANEGRTFLGFLDNVTTDTSFTFTAPVGVLVGQTITATATDLTTNDTSEFFAEGIPVVGQAIADLRVSKTASPDPGRFGEDVAYTIIVTNDGPSAAIGVTVIDALPTNTVFVSATGGVTPVGGVLTFDLGTLANGSTATVTIVVRPTGNVGDPVTNIADVTSAVSDPDSSDNRAVSSFDLERVANPEAGVADLAVTTFTDAPDPVAAGRDLTYTIVVANNGPSSATSVVLTAFPLPANVEFVSTSAGAFDSANNRVVANLGSLAVGGTASVTIVVRPTAAAIGTTLFNTVNVAAAETDPNPANNLTQVATTVIAPPTDTTGPTVVSLQRFGFHAQPTLLVLNFSEDLEPVRAADRANYRLVAPGRDGRFDTRDDVVIATAAIYNATTRAVTLRPSRRLNLHRVYQLTMNGTGPGGLTDLAGNGLAGGRFVARVDRSLLAKGSTGSSTARRIPALTTPSGSVRFTSQARQ